MSNVGSVSTSENYKYEFQKDPKEGVIRTTERAKMEGEKFLKRVNSKVEFDNLDPTEQILITDYMKASVLNIEWYQKKIKQENGYWWIYTFTSFGLLLLLPSVLFILSSWQPASQSFNFAGSLVAILSSIIAFQKAFSGWFKNRLRRGEFWRASSKIKENLYGLEGEYDGRATNGGKLTEEFKGSVRRATAQCRKVASDEQQAFFDQETLPSFDLGKAVISARKEAESLMSSSAPPVKRPKGP